jgi:hypothetical protein
MNPKFSNAHTLPISLAIILLDLARPPAPLVAKPEGMAARTRIKFNNDFGLAIPPILSVIKF